jgi:hypothetical protein
MFIKVLTILGQEVYWYQSKFLILGGWANPVVEPETLDDITQYD